ncbi:2808_t:CDS:2 [Acaulospora colombiana]|uniref:2808_t:CDS:1 n=1 Tax=Acaulospora colombiana TaxID=27376 RepID=A0ACA9MZA2_9GLOM|nr:2808_t:CDS:2 [Acaulospora colombiana]
MGTRTALTVLPNHVPINRELSSSPLQCLGVESVPHFNAETSLAACSAGTTSLPYSSMSLPHLSNKLLCVEIADFFLVLFGRGGLLRPLERLHHARHALPPNPRIFNVKHKLS